MEFRIFDTVQERAPANVSGPDEYNRWLEKRFEQMDDDGWELVAASENKYIFKRVKA